jgi:hypothetical protein
MCQGEDELGMWATYRLRELLGEEPFELTPIPVREQRPDSFICEPTAEWLVCSPRIS